MSRSFTAAANTLPADTTAATGQACLVAGGLLLGTLGLFAWHGGQDALGTVWYRCLFGGLFLTAWLAGTRQWSLLRLTALQWACAAGAGLLMIASWCLFFASLTRITLGAATVIVHVQPFLLMGLGALCLGERLGRTQLLAAAVALLGLGLTVGDAGAQGAGAWGGVAMGLASALCYAAAPMVAKQARGVAPLAMSWVQCAVGVLALAAWAPAHTRSTSPEAWLWLAGLGVLHTGLAYVLIYAGVARLPAARIALLNFVYPATAVVVDWLAFGHRFTLAQWLGVALLGGALGAGAWRGGPVARASPRPS